MKLTNHEWLRAGGWLGLLSIVMGLTGMGLESAAHAQAVSTTTVQGTVYLANGQPATGTLVLSWPSFTTASGQLVVADSTTVTIAPDGFVSVNLAPNLGATPAGQFYTAVYYLSDGTTSTEYWVIPAGAQATLGQVQAQLMPAAQAAQTVSKSYVDQAIASLAGGILTVTGATMTGALTLCCDPTQPLQAADKHYVDENIALEVPLAGGSMTGPLTSVKIGALYQVDQFSGADFGAKLSACLSGLSQTQGGTCDARNFTGTLSMGSNLTISTANATVQLPCATISTANQIIVTAGTRNVSLRGCALRGASTASGSQGGTVFLYSGTGAMVQVGDPTYAADTMGFHLDNAVINTTTATSATAQGFLAYRAQEMDLESLYLLGNSNQTGMTLDGTGNYTGGTFYDDEFTGFQTAVNAIGHQVSNPATTDWLNASTFVRLHIDCPTSGGNPISGSYGINLQQGDGNTITGGDVEGCATALHLGANAQNNTIVGLRNENSTNQVVADAGSAYNNWMTGGTLFTGALTDNGTRNSFLDTFHRSFNGLNGDWYGSQKDATVTNHYRLGIGTGNERGLLNRYQTDYGYRWTMGLSDATAGEQFYQILDELNNVYRVSIGQYNNGQSSTNNQTVINSAGTGAVVLNGSNNSGTGGVVIGSGGASETTVAAINNAGNAQFNGTLQVGGTSTLAGTPTVKNQADAEIDATLWAGLTASQKESFIYKDWNGNSQWYMVKDASNNWALNSATGGLDSFKAYQSTNSGDTYINASNASGVVRVNYETGAGAGFNIYGGGNSLYASFTGTTAIKFPGLAASSGHNCLQIDNSGFITNTGAACGAGGSNGTVNAGTSGQIAYYSGTGTAISGTNTVSIAAGGTGASSASGALANLGGVSITGAAFTGPVSAPSVIAGTVAAGASVSGITNAVVNPAACVSAGAPSWCGASGQTADVYIRAACGQLPANGGTIDLRGFGATTQVLAGPITGCMSQTKEVLFLVDNQTYFMITESDGGTVFPLDESSGVAGSGLGECDSLIVNPRGFGLATTANVTSIFGPAHTNMTQEDLTVKGVCMNGAAGATVTKGLIYIGGIGGTNTSVSDNFVAQCNNACLWIENSGGSMSVHGNEFNVTSGNYAITGSPIVLYAYGGGGVRLGDIFIFNNNIEHANGGASYPELNIYDDGSGATFQQINVHDNYFERNASGTPDVNGIYVEDCVDCKFENDHGGGTSGGSDFIHVADSVATRIHNVQFENIGNGGSWTNTLNDTVTGTTISYASNPDITSYNILPGYWQQNVSPNTALVGPGTDIMGGAGLFSGTGTTYTGWNTFLAGLTSGQATYSLNISDPPNNPTISGGASSQDITIGANSAPQGSAAGVQTGASYGMMAGKTYNVSYQARVISGSINTVLPYVGVGGVSNCTPPFQYVTITSSWQTYSFQCTALSTESVGVLIQAVMYSAGSLTGDVRVGDIQIQPYLSLVPGDLNVGQTDNMSGPFIGTAYCFLYQSAAKQTACLAGNTAATDDVMVSHGTGSAAAAPTLSNAPALSATNMTNFPVVPTATNLAGGVAGSTPIQTAPGATGFVAPNATGSTDAVLTSTSASSAYSATTYKNAPALSAVNMTSFPSTVIQNAGCGNTGSLCLYHSGQQSAVQSNSGSAATLYTYSLPANTLNANGCVNMQLYVHHNTGSTATTYTISVAGAIVSWAPATVNTNELYYPGRFCNNGSTSGGTQSIMASAGVGNTGSSNGGSPQFIGSLNRPNTSALTITATFTTAGTSDYVTPDDFLVQLIQ